MKYLDFQYEKLFHDFSSPLDFISTYTSTYDALSTSPYKIFYDEVPYSKKFDITFLDHLFQYILANTDRPADLERYLRQIEDTILECKSKRFHDTDFYELCSLIYIKALVFLIDQCEFKLLSYNMQADPEEFVPYLGLFYRFSSTTLDVSSLFLDQMKAAINNVTDLAARLEKARDVIEGANALITDTSFASSFVQDKRYLDRMNVSARVVGKVRVSKYSFEALVDSVVDMLKTEPPTQSSEEKYLRLMDFASEIELRNLGTESIYSKVRLVALNTIK